MVYIVTSTRNRKELTIKYINCLLGQTYKDIEIIIVDDGSIDGTKEAIESLNKNIHIIVGDGNLWWTGATRLGVQYAKNKAKKGDYILIQNDDTYFNEAFISDLVSLSEKYNRMIIGSTVKEYDSKKIVYNSCKLINNGYRPVVLENVKNEIIDTDTISGRGVIVPIEVFNSIDNYSKLLPHYGADYEFILRAKRKGFKIGMSRDIVTYSTKSNSLGLSGTIKAKKKNSFKDFIDLFFQRRSSNNLYSSTFITLFYVPFPKNIIGAIRIYLYMIKFLFVNVLLGNAKSR